MDKSNQTIIAVIVILSFVYDDVIFLIPPDCHKNVNVANHSITIHVDLKIVRVHRSAVNCFGLMVDCFWCEVGGSENS